MKRSLDKARSIAILFMLVMVSLVIVFHVLIIVGVIPWSIVWAGRIQSTEEMFVFEAVSIGINIVLGIALLIRGGYLKTRIGPKVANVIIWVFAGIFAVNTVGNTMAVTDFERNVFTPMTLVFTLLCILIASGASRETENRK